MEPWGKATPDITPPPPPPDLTAVWHVRRLAFGWGCTVPLPLQLFLSTILITRINQFCTGSAIFKVHVVNGHIVLSKPNSWEGSKRYLEQRRSRAVSMTVTLRLFGIVIRHHTSKTTGRGWLAERVALYSLQCWNTLKNWSNIHHYTDS